MTHFRYQIEFFTKTKMTKKDTLLGFAEDLSKAFAQLNEVDKTNLNVWFAKRDQEAEAWEQFDNERWTTASLKKMEEEKNEA